MILADKKIDARETRLLKEAILDDGVVDEEELDLLVELRNDAETTHPGFERFFFMALKEYMLSGRYVSVPKVNKLRDIIMADGIIGRRERWVLREIQNKAGRCVRKFDKIFGQYLKKKRGASRKT
jgi:uncharacterized tellurite resistance protein B-like protein